MESKPEDEASAAAVAFAEAVAIMARLRGPDGCPWDREQSFDSIRKYTLEETYEVFDAIERRNWDDLQEELGDLLLQVLFYSQMAAEPGYFNIGDVVVGLNRKLVRRHPHVFGDQASIDAGNAAAPGMETTGIDARQVLRNWEQIKKAEKAATPGSEPPSMLDSVPRSFPALLEAGKLGSKAAKVGFDWPSVDGVFEKIDEELAELREAIQRKKGQDDAQHLVEEEVGDMLFSVVNLARHLGVDAEMALRRTNQKFRSRFRHMELSTESSLVEQSPAALESLWAAAKASAGSPAAEDTK